MKADERQRTLEWAEWYRANRPRHEGSADVQRQLTFVMRALDGVYSTLMLLAASDARRDNGGVIALPRVERHE